MENPENSQKKFEMPGQWTPVPTAFRMYAFGMWCTTNAKSAGKFVKLEEERKSHAPYF